MKTIIAGSRHISYYSATQQAIKECGWTITSVLSGKASGPDAHGLVWARANKIPYTEFPANWTRFGKRAGMLRNNEMAFQAEALIAIWDGISVGTSHMIQVARIRKLRIYILNV